MQEDSHNLVEVINDDQEDSYSPMEVGDGQAGKIVDFPHRRQ